MFDQNKVPVDIFLHDGPDLKASGVSFMSNKFTAFYLLGAIPRAGEIVQFSEITEKTGASVYFQVSSVAHRTDPGVGSTHGIQLSLKIVEQVRPA